MTGSWWHAETSPLSHVVQAGLRLKAILLLQSSKCWDYRQSHYTSLHTLFYFCGLFLNEHRVGMNLRSRDPRQGTMAHACLKKKKRPIRFKPAVWDYLGLSVTACCFRLYGSINHQLKKRKVGVFWLTVLKVLAPLVLVPS